MKEFDQGTCLKHLCRNSNGNQEFRINTMTGKIWVRVFKKHEWRAYLMVLAHNQVQSINGSNVSCLNLQLFWCFFWWRLTIFHLQQTPNLKVQSAFHHNFRLNLKSHWVPLCCVCIANYNIMEAFVGLQCHNVLSPQLLSLRLCGHYKTHTNHSLMKRHALYLEQF